jgi:hypothetical protein
MGDFTAIVLSQSRAKIDGYADVEMLGIKTCNDIDVLHQAILARKTK